MSAIRLPCLRCAGTGWDTHEDRHTMTNRDVCRPCAGTGFIEARTGETRESSADPATGRAPSPAIDGATGGRR